MTGRLFDLTFLRLDASRTQLTELMLTLPRSETPTCWICPVLLTRTQGGLASTGEAVVIGISPREVKRIAADAAAPDGSAKVVPTGSTVASEASRPPLLLASMP